jgi:branched-subunit amino acid aminotransferase/4-amino-4-deoxychorismate lyase
MTMKNLLAPAAFEFAVTVNEAARSAAERADIMANPGFGKHFTDHMVDICWSQKGGWHRPRVQPYGPIALDPAAAVLHYGQEIFEGLKAYRHADGSIWSFRPEANAARMQRSAIRLALPQLDARAHGCSQVLFLDPVEGKYLEELGGMNVFLVYADGRLVTPELSGSILEGVTRSSILQLARDRGMRVEERKVSIDEWKSGVASGDITEAFACGTAAVVTPIGELKGRDFSVGDINAPAGEVTLSIRDELTGIQYGRIPDRHGWLVRLR